MAGVAGRLGPALGAQLEQDASEKIIKGTVAKLQGTDVFHLEPAERKRRGGWVGRDGGKRKKSQDRQEWRSRVSREEDERSGKIRGRERE